MCRRYRWPTADKRPSLQPHRRLAGVNEKPDSPSGYCRLGMHIAGVEYKWTGLSLLGSRRRGGRRGYFQAAPCNFKRRNRRRWLRG
ncbi:hypothetical protein THAOC_10973 [Thalassiosira oceanica]|uniref:Uncharacterized protein n=1 Tax=Thalassiosira oceanica TaxID=159749 RepID=K0TBQ1_THAOC|nr:hypothetical protein THAOC_10973 [Thalassiosira oceanica]|eukprot:EJK67917.1 hypothetical protein THAOC_10973 [Thalassiosira oceanica]